MINEEGIKDLIAREADAPIFSRLRLTYGKALQFKATFGKIYPEVRKSLKPLTANKFKPKLEDMANFTSQQRTDYILK